MRQPNTLDSEYFERLNLMEALTKEVAGVAFLQWLCRLTGFNRPIMNLHDASRRELWLTIRQYIPIEKLPEIELSDLRLEQEQARQLMNLQLAAFEGES